MNSERSREDFICDECHVAFSLYGASEEEDVACPSCRCLVAVREPEDVDIDDADVDSADDEDDDLADDEEIEDDDA